MNIFSKLTCTTETFVVLILCLVAFEVTKQAYCKTIESSELKAVQVNATSGTNVETHSAGVPQAASGPGYMGGVVNRQKRHPHHGPSQKPTPTPKVVPTKAVTPEVVPTKAVTPKVVPTKAITPRTGSTKRPGTAVSFIPSKILLVVAVMLTMVKLF